MVRYLWVLVAAATLASATNLGHRMIDEYALTAEANAKLLSEQGTRDKMRVMMEKELHDKMMKATRT
jgi:hypothetical protein